METNQDKIVGLDVDRLRPIAIRLFNKDDFESLQQVAIKVIVARCARISYFNYEGKDDYDADVKLCNRLFGNNPKHLSPTEHVAQALNKPEQIGNFIGFKQYRKFFLDENLKDDRIKIPYV